MAVSFVELDYLLAEVVSAWFVKCLCFGVAMNPGAWSHHCDIDLAASLLRRKLRLTVRSILYNDNASRESRRWHVHGRIVPILLYFTQTENHSIGITPELKVRECSALMQVAYPRRVSAPWICNHMEPTMANGRNLLLVRVSIFRVEGA